MTHWLGHIINIQKVTIHKYTWSFGHVITCSHVTNRNCCICNATSFMHIKIERVVGYDKEPPPTKSLDSLMTWPYVVLWEKESVICLIPHLLCAPNVTEWWLMTWGHHPKNQITDSKKLFLFMRFLSTRQCNFNLI